MTLFTPALVLAACLGWTLHTRMLRGALNKAWAEIDKLKAELEGEIDAPKAQIDDPPALEGAPRIDDLLTELDTFTLADLQQARAALEERFLVKHGTHAEDIDTAICRGVLPCDDPLVEEWVELHALEPYVSAEDV